MYVNSTRADRVGRINRKTVLKIIIKISVKCAKLSVNKRYVNIGGGIYIYIYIYRFGKKVDDIIFKRRGTGSVEIADLLL